MKKIFIFLIVVIIIGVTCVVVIKNKKDLNYSSTNLIENKQTDKNKELEKKDSRTEIDIEKIKSDINDYESDIGLIDNLEYEQCFENNYRFIQKYKGIEVYGGGVVASYKNNELTSVINYNYEIPDDFNITPTSSEKELLKVAQEALKTDKDCMASKLIIYPKNLTDFALAYLYDFGYIKVIVSDADNKVLTKSNDIDAFFALSNNKDDMDLIEDYKTDDGSYVLNDKDRHISFYRIKDEYEIIENENYLINNTDYYTVGKWDSLDINSEGYKAFQSMKNLQMIFDYYKNVFGHKSIKMDEDLNLKVFMNFRAMYNDSGELNDYSDNAALEYINKDDIRIYFGSQNKWNEYLDVVAHEYAHAYVNYIAEVGNEKMTKAVNEGYADLLAMMTEAYYSDNKLDGNVGERYVSTDTKTYFDYNEEEDYHYMSTIVSKVAYLMSVDSDLELDLDELCKLWFNSLYKLPKFRICFDDVERAVLLQAKEFGYTQEQIRKMADIFVSLNYPDYYNSCMNGNIINPRRIVIQDSEELSKIMDYIIAKQEGDKFSGVEYSYDEIVTEVKGYDGYTYYAVNIYTNENLDKYGGEWLEKVEEGKYYLETYYIRGWILDNCVFCGINPRDFGKYKKGDTVPYFHQSKWIESTN